MDKSCVYVDYLLEVSFLGREPHNGVKYLGERNPISVSEHSFIAAHVAVTIAIMEGKDMKEAAFIMLFHDLPESRMGDMNSINKNYVKAIIEEDKILLEQIKAFPKNLREEIIKYFLDFEEHCSDMGKITKDADVIALVISLLEYKARGLQKTELFLKNSKNRLYTESGKKLFNSLLDCDASDFGINRWWYSNVLDLE